MMQYALPCQKVIVKKHAAGLDTSRSRKSVGLDCVIGIYACGALGTRSIFLKNTKEANSQTVSFPKNNLYLLEHPFLSF
jgi:hypothetical protein